MRKFLVPLMALAIILSSCGQQSPHNQQPAKTVSGHIIGGTAVTGDGSSEDITKHWLNTVALTEGGKQYCTGTLIHERVVLTAAHCIAGYDPTQTTIYIGQGKEGGKIQGQHKVIYGEINPMYLKHLIGHADTAFLVLENPVKEVKPVKLLVDLKERLEVLQKGNKVRLVGFGLRDLEDDTQAGRKFQVETKINYKNSNEIVIGEVGKDSCYGDSGGPAFVQMKDKSWRHFGVVSRGTTSGCGNVPEPGVYGLVHDSLCWMQSSLAGRPDTKDIVLSEDMSVCGYTTPDSSELTGDLVKDCEAPDTPAQARTFLAVMDSIGASSCQELQQFRKGITQLSLVGYDLTDLAPLSYFENLRLIDLSENKLSSLEQLEALKTLEVVNIRWNDIKAEKLAALKQKGVRVFGDDVQYSNYYDNAFYRLCEDDANATDLQALTMQSIFYSTKQFSCKEASQTVQCFKYLEITPYEGADLSILSGFSELKKLKVLTAKADLSPLQDLVNLEELEVGLREQPVDLKQISSLPKLHSLNISSEEVLNHSEFKNFPSLKGFALQNYRISDIAPYAEELAHAKNLKVFSFNGTKVSDLTPVTKLKNIIGLSFEYAEVKDISPLTEMTNLRLINANGNTIEDISPLAGLTELTDLNLGRNPIKDFGPLQNLAKLRELNLSRTGAKDPSFLKNMADLRVLDLSSNGLGDISDFTNSFKNLKKLASLQLNYSEVKSLKGFDQLWNLSTLSIKRNKLTDTTPLKDLALLKRLDLSYNSLQNFSGLNGLISLEKLEIPGAQVKDEHLEQLSNALTTSPSLQLLNLSGNQITKPAPLGKLNKVRLLDLSFNKVTDISKLAGMEGLAALYLAGNPLAAGQVCPFSDSEICKGI